MVGSPFLSFARFFLMLLLRARLFSPAQNNTCRFRQVRTGFLLSDLIMMPACKYADVFSFYFIYQSVIVYLLCKKEIQDRNYEFLSCIFFLLKFSSIINLMPLAAARGFPLDVIIMPKQNVLLFNSVQKKSEQPVPNSCC